MNYDEIYDEALKNFHEKNYDESIKLLNCILEENDNHFYSWNLLGNIFFNMNNLDVAKDFFLAAINKKEDFFDAYYMLANVLFKANFFEDAINIWNEGIKHNPNFALSYANIAIAYDRLNKKEEAIFYAKKALSLDENCLEANFCLAKIYQHKIDIENTKTYLEKVVKLDTNNALANFDLSYVYLCLEMYKKGFEHFEFRKQMPNRLKEYNYLPFKEYENENLENKHFLLYHEQGFGDNIQFIRFLNETDIKGLAVGIQNPLNRLFSFNFPNVEFLDEINEAMEFDFSAALMSLPYILKLEKISSKAYLDVHQKDLQDYKSKNIDNSKLNIGLVWKGSTAKNEDDVKSISLKNLDEILSKDCNFYNLQIEDYEEINDYNIKNLGCEFKDFYDTSLAIKSMDLIIGVDTAVSHLSGALGVKTFVIYESNTIDFRWMEKNKKSIWYESAEVYKKDEINLINRKIEELIKDKNDL